MGAKIKKIVGLVILVLLIMIIVHYISYQSIDLEQIVTMTSIAAIGISLGVLTPNKSTLKKDKND